MRYLVGNHLHKSGGVQIGSLLGLHRFADHLHRGNNPSQAQARR